MNEKLTKTERKELNRFKFCNFMFEHSAINHHNNNLSTEMTYDSTAHKLTITCKQCGKKVEIIDCDSW